MIARIVAAIALRRSKIDGNPFRLRFVVLLGLLIAGCGTSCLAAESGVELADSFTKQVQPFFKQHCVRCHHGEKLTSGIRVDHLTAALEDSQLKLWGEIRRQITDGVMPPEDEPQPTKEQRQQVVAWIDLGLNFARSRPTPKNGGTRRLTVAQYRNTLRELLLLEDDLTELLPADAVSRDGFVNNQETLALSPLLLEAYFDIAQQALDRSIVDVRSKPTIQHFRVDMGTGINPQPCPDQLILGAGSLLLNNSDVVVSQPALTKAFPFQQLAMQTKWRFNEGYAGNSTVRGWREYDSIYHSVYACMRGSNGYPKGRAYSTVPEGLLLRPAITSDETFRGDGTYGPKANFKISVRELPDQGRFRVTVTAAKYDDGLLLDPGTPPQSIDAAEVVVHDVSAKNDHASSTVALKHAGVYQVDIYPAVREEKRIAPDNSKLNEELVGHWKLDADLRGSPDHDRATGRFVDDAKLAPSPFGQGVTLDGKGDAIVVPRHADMNVGTGEFTVAAWINPAELRQAGIVCLGKYAWTNGWYLDMPGKNGVLRIETVSPEGEPNGTVQSPPKAIRANAWQHVAAVVRRGKNQTQLFINGYQVATGTIGGANLDNPKVDLHIGRIQGANEFRGQLDEVRIYRRALSENEIQALVEPGRKFAVPVRETLDEVTLTIGTRQFSNRWQQPAFLAVRLPAGELPVQTHRTGTATIGRVVFTPLAADAELAKRFAIFEARSPRVGVHLGLRRDCGSSLAQVGSPQTVVSTTPDRFVFEGAIRNYPSPEVQKDNDNYLAGVREIGVRSENTDGRDMPRLLIKSVEFEGPFYDAWPPQSHRNLFGDASDDTSLDAARRIIRDFATRAFRRPISATEERSLLAVFEKSRASNQDFTASVKDALHVVLTSPQFLFLIENSKSPQPEPIDDFELASKLSYFLWNGPPDSTTLKLAADGKLRQELNREVTRLIADPRFGQFVSEFTGQWLALDKFSVLEPDRTKFPKLVRDTRAQLRQEPIQFVKHLLRQNLPVRNLVESDFLIANEVVASYYDLADRTESGLEFILLPHQRRDLGGILSQAAIMAGLSDGRESNPVKRGAWLARRIVAEPPDDPPPNVPTLKEDVKLSLRERLEQHRNQPGCAQCHSKIDPWGVPFEEYDAGGRFKTVAVDARSTLPDKTEIANVAELKRYLAEDRIDQLAFSVLKHLSIYANGRSLTYNELEFLKQDGRRLKADGYRLQDILRYVVHSPMFLEK